MTSMQRCDSCGAFGELETVTVEIKKHPACDINGAFGKPVVQMPTMQTTITPVSDQDVRTAVPTAEDFKALNIIR